MAAAPNVTVTSSDGTRIAAWRTGAGPALVLVHGTTADHTRWSRITPALERSFTVFAMDRRGRGASGDAELYSVAQEGDDVAAVLAQAGPRASLLGHSYGALCCVEAALQTPTLQRLVLYEPPLPTGIDIVRPEVQQRLDTLIERDEREAALLLFFREVVQVAEAQLDVMRAHPAWPGRIAAAHTLTRESRLEAEYDADLARLRSLTTPTLLLLGGDSPPLFRQATLQFKDAIPNSRIHEMPGQQHVAMDMIPDEFVAIVSSFLMS
jgi:pimeloyl-ACP methyl ester carboxylesterase